MSRWKHPLPSGERRPYPVVRLTAEQIAEMVELREQGWSYRRLALRYHVSEGAVHYQCLKHGALSPRQVGATPGPALRTDRHGRVMRAFSPEEDQRITELSIAGYGVTAIARQVRRGYTSVRIRLMTLAQHDAIASGEHRA